MKKLTKRFEMRCTPADFRRWAQRAQELGLPSVATFLRIVANEAIPTAPRKIKDDAQ